MDLQYYGANCVVLASKGVRVVVDDNLAELGGKPVTKAEDVVLFTGAHGAPGVTPKLVVDGPGEYEVAGLSIIGVAARANIDPEGTTSATMYKIIAGDTNYLILGHVYPELSDEQLEAIGMIDVLVAPVGGNGYTLDATGALHLIKKIEPKVVVPTHYADDKLAYPVPSQELEQALKNLAMEPKETTAKLHYKPGADVANSTQLVVVTKS